MLARERISAPVASPQCPVFNAQSLMSLLMSLFLCWMIDDSSEVLGLAAMLAALLHHSSLVDSTAQAGNTREGPDRRVQWAHFFGAMSWLMLGLGSKQTCACMPVLAMAADLGRWGLSPWRSGETGVCERKDDAQEIDAASKRARRRQGHRHLGEGDTLGAECELRAREYVHGLLRRTYVSFQRTYIPGCAVKKRRHVALTSYAAYTFCVCGYFAVRYQASIDHRSS